MELRMQSIATPVSANTAAQMLAKPTNPSTSTSSLTASAKMTFCIEIRPVARAILIACGMALTEEFMKTTSAASMAASAPLPMACTDVCASQNRSVVDTIADEHNCTVLFADLFQCIQFIFRQELCVNIGVCDAYGPGHRIGASCSITSQHGRGSDRPP